MLQSLLIVLITLLQSLEELWRTLAGCEVAEWAVTNSTLEEVFLHINGERDKLGKETLLEDAKNLEKAEKLLLEIRIKAGLALSSSSYLFTDK
jgi:hypothetical protein